MHEYSICESIVSTVMKVLEDQPSSLRVRRVRVVAGAFMQVVPEYLSSAYEAAVEGTPLEGSKVELEIHAARWVCPACGCRGKVEHLPVSCSCCGSVDVSVEGGEELYLESIEVEEDGNQGLQRTER